MSGAAPPTSGMPTNRTGAGGAPGGDSLGLDIFLRKCPNRMGPSRLRQAYSVVGTRGVEPVLEGGFVDTPHHADVWGLGLDPTIRERGAAGGSVETNH